MPKTLAAIFQYTSGVPKLINMFCDVTLMDAELSGNCISPAAVHDTLRKVAWPKQSVADDRDPQVTQIEPESQELAACAELIVTLKSLVIAQIPLRPGILSIGRAPSNELPLNNKVVSRQHCRIFTTPNGSVIEDLNSINDVYVNARRVISLPLADRDIAQIGNHTLVYRSYLGPKS